MIAIGFDTSNYTTSLAVYDSTSDTLTQRRQLLKVKSGEKGLRQSDAVFQHTQNLPQLAQALFLKSGCKADVIGVSECPSCREHSYMPCFTVGLGTARVISSLNAIPLKCFTHQQGHIAAALWSSGQMSLLKEKFIAFHVSGGTTEAVLVTPSKEKVFDCRVIACSSDLKAGQAIDRVGLMLGLDFPCGEKLDKLSRACTQNIKVRPSLKGADCSLSGVENRCRQMIEKGHDPCEVGRYCFEYINVSLEKMVEALFSEYGELPVVFSGGVSANSFMRERMQSRFSAVFASPPYATDNAAGIAVLACL